MHIQKITNDTNPMVTLVFGDIQEYKDYMKEITNINKKIVGDSTIAISEEVLSNILTLFKKTAKKKKDTGEVYITEGLADHFALTEDYSDTPVNLIRR